MMLCNGQVLSLPSIKLEYGWRVTNELQSPNFMVNLRDILRCKMFIAYFAKVEKNKKIKKLSNAFCFKTTYLLKVKTVLNCLQYILSCLYKQLPSIMLLHL
eukprot:TRINITY_DN12303_c0_g1_i1.p3 TRINITY_DN12303_c0_g1~~TRINITY_DN12303_c0_g1_i1.p3  ORF type:complete len:101 (-),score=2.80 TRINITY_DN12303_c0_g1_i1:224-526(-)